MLMSYDFVLTEVDGPVGIVTINRPQVRNALNHQTIAELVDALETFDLNEAIRCMVLTGDDRRLDWAGSVEAAELCANAPEERRCADAATRST